MRGGGTGIGAENRRFAHNQERTSKQVTPAEPGRVVPGVLRIVQCLRGDSVRALCEHPRTGCLHSQDTPSPGVLEAAGPS